MGVTCLFSPTSPNTNNTNNAWRLNSNGNINNNNCTNTNGSRPAFLLPSNYTVEVEGNPLEQYSTRELAEELFRRIGN